MNQIGLFEAKTKFSEICERIAAGGEAIVVTRRGKPRQPATGRGRALDKVTRPA